MKGSTDSESDSGSVTPGLIVEAIKHVEEAMATNECPVDSIQLGDGRRYHEVAISEVLHTNSCVDQPIQWIEAEIACLRRHATTRVKYEQDLLGLLECKRWSTSICGATNRSR